MKTRCPASRITQQRQVRVTSMLVPTDSGARTPSLEQLEWPKSPSLTVAKKTSERSDTKHSQESQEGGKAALQEWLTKHKVA